MYGSMINTKKLYRKGLESPAKVLKATTDRAGRAKARRPHNRLPKSLWLPLLTTPTHQTLWKRT